MSDGSSDVCSSDRGATRNFLIDQVAKLPFVFNVKIHAPFRQLITSAKGFYDPTVVIEQNLPTLLRVQEQVDAARAGAETPVQPSESEPVDRKSTRLNSSH